MANQVQSSGGYAGGGSGGGSVTSVSGTAGYVDVANGTTTPVISLDSAFLSRITTLENNEYKVAYFASVSASSGTITIPTNATILTDQFPAGVDALVSTINSGQPTGFNPQTGGGALVDVASFDTGGNYVLTGTPSAYPVAIIYVLKIKSKDFSNLTIANIIEYYQTDVLTGSGTTNYVPKFSSSSTIANSLIYEDGTNVGIGTTTPHGILSLGNSVQANKLLMYDEILNPTDKYGFGIAASTLQIYSGTGGRNIAFGTYDGTDFSEDARIANGKLGIGTATPSFKLTVAVTNNTDGISLDGTTNPQMQFSTSGTTIALIGIPTGAGGYDIAADLGDIVFGTEGGKMFFNTNSGSGTAALSILGANGNIGIGITNPTYKLQVSGSLFSSGDDFELRDAGTVDVSAVRIFSIAGQLYLQSGSGNKIYFRNATGHITVTFQDDGNVGIGTTTPTALLHLAAGTATASTAPLKLTSGISLTSAETGAMEYDGTNLFFTRSGTTRESVICANAVNSVSPTSPDRTITVVIDGTTYYLAAKTTND